MWIKVVLTFIASLLSRKRRSKPANASKRAAALSSLPEKTIALIEIAQQCLPQSLALTSLADFELCYGSDVLPISKKNNGLIAYCMAAIEDFGAGKVKGVPIIGAYTAPGGPIEKRVWARLKKDILEGLRGIKKLDGIYLSLYGMSGTEGLFDLEGDLLQAIRDEYGAGLPICTSYDMHGNITEKKIKLSNIILCSKMEPNRNPDIFNTGYTAGKLLVQTMLGEIHPVMSINKMRLLRGGGQTVDFLPPMDKIFSRMQKMEKIPGVLNVSNFVADFWQDEPDVGWSTLVITDNNKTLGDKLADELAELDWAVRDYPLGMTLHSPSEAVKAARDSRFARMMGTTIFCDMSDCIGIGAPGENTWILKALMEEGPDLVSYIPIRDGQAVKELWETSLNQTVTLTVGGKLDKIYNRPYEFTGQIIFKGNARGSIKTSLRAVVLKNKGVHMILTEFSDAIYSPIYFTSLGLNLWIADVVVVKNLFPFRFRFLKYNRKTFNVISPGLTNIDVFQIKYKNITRPLYPLDKLDSWQWKKW